MRLLPRKVDIDRSKSLERKREIDEGVALAKRVDALRETAAAEAHQLAAYRQSATAQVQRDVDALLLEKDAIKSEIKEATVQLASLRVPLDTEWQQLNLAKSELEKDKDRIRIAKEQLKAEEARHADDLLKLAAATELQRADREDLKKKRKAITVLQAKTEREYETSITEHNRQLEDDAKSRAEIQGLKASYEVGLTTLELERKQIEEREAGVNKKEELLADRSAMLERDMARLNKE